MYGALIQPEGVRTASGIASSAAAPRQISGIAQAAPARTRASAAAYVSLSQLAAWLPIVRGSNDRGAFTGDELARLLATVTVDPGFADDIEMGVRERREIAASRVSPWER
jgi:hypothetical protein